jgi:hypothetical protein
MLFQRFTMPWKGMTGSIVGKATRNAPMVPPGWTSPLLIVIGIRFNATKLAESLTFTLVSVWTVIWQAVDLQPLLNV